MIHVILYSSMWSIEITFKRSYFSRKISRIFSYFFVSFLFSKWIVMKKNYFYLWKKSSYIEVMLYHWSKLTKYLYLLFTIFFHALPAKWGFSKLWTNHVHQKCFWIYLFIFANNKYIYINIPWRSMALKYIYIFMSRICSKVWASITITITIAI